MKIKQLVIFILLAIFTVSCAQGVKEKTKLETLQEKASYSMGFNIAMNMKNQNMIPDIEAMLAGLKDGLEGGDTLVALAEMGKLITEFQFEKVKKENEDFLTENAKDKEFTVLENGIQYRVLNSGNGNKPTIDDKVKVHYTGKLINGTTFDSSQGKDPIEFGLNGVIPGWRETLQLMKEGDKWEVVIPQELAYGPRGGGRIPPYSTLIFEIEFISIVK